MLNTFKFWSNFSLDLKLRSSKMRRSFASNTKTGSPASTKTSKQTKKHEDVVSVDWLADEIKKKKVKIVDASWELKPRNFYEEDYLKLHLPSKSFALFENIKSISFFYSHFHFVRGSLFQH